MYLCMRFQSSLMIGKGSVMSDLGKRTFAQLGGRMILVIAFAVWVVWEVCAMMYPERFYEMTNAALQCANCTDKLCAQYCQKLRKQK